MPIEQFLLNFVTNAISKTAVAPIERIKLLLQTENELIKQGKLTEPFKGIGNVKNCLYKAEGGFAFFRGNCINCFRYLPAQALSLLFNRSIKQAFKITKEDSTIVIFSKNVM